MSSPPIDYIQQTRDRYDALGHAPYEWAHIEQPPPLASLQRPLSELRVGLIASGGIYRKGQTAFHYKDDVSFRELPMDTPAASLRVTHFAYDQTDARADVGVVFPAQALREAAADGQIGATTAHAYTFMGGIYSQRKVRDGLAPLLADRMEAEGADAVVLVPV